MILKLDKLTHKLQADRNCPPVASPVPENSLCRRGFLKLAGSAGMAALAVPSLLLPESGLYPFLNADTLIPENKGQDLALSFYNRHTGESIKKCIFWAEGKYNPDALKDINKLFRDHRTHGIHDIDPNLLQVLHKIHQKLETAESFHLISGYRSPKSNKMLKSQGRGVASASQHIHGKAADIYVPGRSLKNLQKAAKSLGAGGVGRYAGFVHVDTGRVRYWGLA